MFGSSHVSVPRTMSGFTLLSMFESLHCFILIAWKFTLRIRSGNFVFVCWVLVPVGVEECIGWSLCPSS